MNNGICVFCSSSDAVDPPYFHAATRLGELIAAAKRPLVYGGGHIGLMGAVARAVHAHNGHVIGVIPNALQEKELAYAASDELILTRDLRERKAIMFDRASAFIALPGGFGTLEEMIEVLTLKQLSMHDKALVFLNIEGFYDPLVTLFNHFYEHRFAKPACKDLYHVATTPEDAMHYIKTYQPAPVGQKWY